MVQKAFEGIKIAEFAWVLAGPHTSSYLGHHGATVVKIESHRRLDPGRVSSPFVDSKPGIDLMKYKVMAFAIGSFFAGVAGSFYGHYLWYITPQAFTFRKSVQILMFPQLGGEATILGPILGAVLLTFFGELTRAFSQYETIVYGAMLILTMIFLPQGLISVPAMLRERRVKRSLKAKPRDVVAISG